MGSENAFSGDTNYTMLNYETQNTSSQELTYWASCKLEDSMYLTQSLSLTLSGSSCAPDSNKTLTTSSWPSWLATLSGGAPFCGECTIIPCKRISQAQQTLKYKCLIFDTWIQLYRTLMVAVKYWFIKRTRLACSVAAYQVQSKKDFCAEDVYE